ncbi:MAG: lipoprotein insertase outer membrane protein LolB [Gammaproteobacteria bacterium]|nr:lipoprotein insertase outer membrane protein LolB [Gammaproteobacteria bacterium]
MRLARVPTAALAALLLGGCTTLVMPQGAANRAAWQDRQARLELLRCWHLEGRIGVVTPDKGGSASFDWREQGGRMTLQFSGPFGIGAVKLTGNAERFVIRNSKGEEWVTYTPSQALARTLGWPVPVASLRYWVTGRPAPGEPYELHLDARGLVTSLEQQGWTVRYSAYMPVAGLLLPARLVASRPNGHIKLIVSEWNLGERP